MNGLPWHKRDHSARYDETRRISPTARGILSDLVDTMYRTGKPIPHDIPYLCHLCALRDKRQVEKPLAELIASGLILVTDAGLTNTVAMDGIAEANKHIANGKEGGRGKKKASGDADQSAISSRSVPDQSSISSGSPHTENEQNQSLSQKAIDKDKEEEKKEESPLPPKGESASDLFRHSEPETDKPKKQRKARATSAFSTSEMDGFFAEFRLAYPPIDLSDAEGGHHWVGARTHFNAAVKSGVDPKALIAAAQRYCAETKSNKRYGTSYTSDVFNWLKAKKWVKYNGVHQFPAAADKSQDGEYKFAGDKNNPPVGFDDLPTGTKRGWWVKTSRGWNRLAS